MQAYRRTNIVLLTISVIAIVLPAIILPARLAAPGLFPSCYSILILNRPCPMCGLTRGIGSIVWGRFGEAMDYNVMSFAFLVIFLLEILFRSCLLSGSPDVDKLEVVQKYDLSMHAALVFIYLLYAICFHICL